MLQAIYTNILEEANCVMANLLTVGFFRAFSNEFMYFFMEIYCI